MHILTLTSLFPNAAQPVFAVFIRNRMENFARKYGIDWTIVAPVPYFPRLPFSLGGKYGQYSRVPAREDLGGFEVHHPRYLVVPKVGMRHYGGWMARSVRSVVRDIHRRKPIDAIDCHYIYPDGTAGIRMGAELGVPVVLSARGTDLNLYPRMKDIAPLLKRNLEACHHLICVCEDLKTEALALGVPAEKISVIGNGVDTAVFRRMDQGAARKALGLPAAARIVLSVGHLIERKGFHILLDAFAPLARQGALLAIAGDGEERDRLKDQARKLGLGDSVRFAGAVLNRDLPAWYSAADVFALASSREGWPNVLCEAQAIGLPIVATRVWGVPEIVNHPDLGLLVPERTPEALGAALAEALHKDWNRSRIEEKGQSRTWDKVSDEVARVFLPPSRTA